MRPLLAAAVLMVSGCASILPPNRAVESCDRPWKVCIVESSCYYCQEAATGGAANCVRTLTPVTERSKKIDLVVFGDSVVEMSWLDQCDAQPDEEET